MTHNHSLPVILVSAVDEASAETIISGFLEIIDNESPETNTTGCCRVWRLVNKYYTADVALRPAGDDALGGGDDPPAQAHLIYLTEQECRESAAETAERRAARGGMSGDAGVLLALCQAGETDLPAALRAWALRRRAELVPLRAVCEEDGEPHSIARVRAALHAHRWRAPALSTCEPADSASDSDSEWSEWTGAAEGSEVDVERFAAALRLASAARGELRALPRHERLDRAEQLLAALCEAMHQPHPHLHPTPSPPPPPTPPAEPGAC